ncbi:hypothetical protein [Bradyrhizobium sp. ARR65]|uniref:hypothetical protein n=1 Tax=Bradyrhizobium sp. ARR65 TaxID=1040989 RepID=UPI000464BC8D|nr:hypothetical protein [Bradyrhizobium sp. ARR65]
MADHALSVSPGSQVSLGIGVSVPHAGDNVTVNISGLPNYETITDNLDGKTFSGRSVTLTAGEVNSGLTLNSSYRGHGHPTATLTVTTTDATGTPVTSAAQTITVKDPPATTTSSSTSTTMSAAANSGTSTPTTTDNSTLSGRSPSTHIDVGQWFNTHPDFARAATTLSEAGASKSGDVLNLGTTTDAVASAGAKAYALFNQMMAGDFGGESHFAQAATALSAPSQQQANLLTRPLH